MAQKIIFDTDPGIDDAMALLFALASPELEIVGLTTIFGNVHTDLATQNALRLLEFAGRPEIPVAHGAANPAPARRQHANDRTHTRCFPHRYSPDARHANVRGPNSHPCRLDARGLYARSLYAHDGSRAAALADHRRPRPRLVALPERLPRRGRAALHARG